MSRPKFVPAKEQDFTPKVRHVIETTHCMKHGAKLGHPCWWIHSDSLVLFAAVCGKRAKQVYDGAAKPKSFGNKRPRNQKEQAA